MSGLGSGAFENSQVPLSCSEYTYNKQSKVRYHHGVDRVIHGKCNTSDGKLKMDCSGFLINTHSFESLLSLTYGQNLCVPCDLSSSVFLPVGQHNCKCEIPLPVSLINDLEELLKIHGVPDPAEFFNIFNMNVDTMTWTTPWNLDAPPQTWNSSYVTFVADPSATIISLCGPSGSTYIYDGSLNVLDPSGGNFDGSGVCIRQPKNLFGGDNCNDTYYPAGTYAVDMNVVLNMMMFYEPDYLKSLILLPSSISLYDYWLALGLKPEIPPMNQYNYLNGVNGMAYPGPIRFWRMQGQFS